MEQLPGGYTLNICAGAFPLSTDTMALSGFVKPVMTPAALDNLSLVGNVLIFCVGINLVWGKKIKVANLLPAIVVAVAAAFLPM